ncbi:MAG: hypothetical protein AMXMBFR46_21490 [Acidimicrobiia bacterium]
MLARLAEDLYWGGRYLERLQHTARVLDVTTESVFTSPRGDQHEIWRLALATLVLEHAYHERFEEIDGTTVSGFCVVDPENTGSIASLIRALRENVRRVRELVSSELWESVNDLYLRFFATNLRRDLDAHPAQLYAFVKSSAHAIVGVAVETMSRDEAARFFELGMHMERAGTTTRVLGTQAAALESVGMTGLEAWAPVLRICAARETFVRTGRQADAASVGGLLLFSPVFPRSVRYSLAVADEHVVTLLDDAEQPAFDPPDEHPLVARLLGRLRSRLDYGDIDEVTRAGLAPTAVSLETDLREVHKAIAERFFHHVPVSALQVQELRSMQTPADPEDR